MQAVSEETLAAFLSAGVGADLIKKAAEAAAVAAPVVVEVISDASNAK